MVKCEFELPQESINNKRYIIAEYSSVEEAQTKLKHYLKIIMPNRKLYLDHPEMFALYSDLLFYEIVETN